MSKSNLLYKAVELNWSKLTVKNTDERGIGSSLGIRPEMFLHFSKEDLRSKMKHALINSYSNAMRAIDAQVDEAVQALGLNLATKKKTVFQKIDMLYELDLLPFEPLVKIADIRHRWEKYVPPFEGEVTEAITAAASFIEACNKALGEFQSAFGIGEKETIIVDGYYQHCIQVRYEWRIFKVSGVRDRKTVEEIFITADDPEFKALLKLAFAIGRRGDIVGALKKLQRIMRK